MRRVIHKLPALALGSLAALPAVSADVADLHFGEALYHAHQGHYFEALQRLDAEVEQHSDVDEPHLDSLWTHIDDAEFSLGDFELRYRMHHRAGRAIRAVLEGAVDDEVRNDAAYRLARIHFQKGQIAEAGQAIGRIDGRVPDGLEDDIDFLRANIHLALGQNAAAATVLERLADSADYAHFAAYNLGVASLQGGQRQAAYQQFDRAGALAASSPADLAIRDKSNLVLGTLLMEDGEDSAARHYLNRVRLDGPYSNKALLSAGWAAMNAGDAETAAVPWSLLAAREVSDAAAQEAKLALPYAYGKLNVHGRAAIQYGEALDAFSGEIVRLTDSIDSIRAGRFLDALVREEIRQNEDWVIRLRELPETPETFYLIELLAGHDFQTGLQNYLDLADLVRRLRSWQSGFDAFDDIVDHRESHFEPLLPGIDEEFRKLDSRMRLRIEQHRMLVKRRDDLLTTPRPEFLATRDEQAALAMLEAFDPHVAASDSPVYASLRQRIDRLKGILRWTLETEYHQRLTDFDRNLRDLEPAMTLLETKYAHYVRTRQAATHSYTGYDMPIRQLRVRVATAIDEVERLMARQGRQLEIVAIDELAARRARLEAYRDKARFALADSYDRATQAQARARGAGE